MKVFVTGAGGFVGRWLAQELGTAGHEVIEAGGSDHLDVRDPEAVRDALQAARPDAIVHLAAVAFAPQAREEPAAAFGVTVGGTVNLFEAVRALDPSPVVLVAGSSEVYGSPDPEDLPLHEEAPLRPRSPYALSKIAQESVAMAYATRYGIRSICCRPFNHAGPGQRPDFAIPAFARRVLAVREGSAEQIRVGNVDVRRDYTDVRDVVRAYRLLLQAALTDHELLPPGTILNVCSGASISIRWVIEELCRVAGVPATLVTDPALVRADDAEEVRGDRSRLERLIDWRPEIPLRLTLADVWAEVAGAEGESPRR